MVVEIKTTKVKTKLTDKVLEEIKYLNNKIYDEEWSGVLFYKIIGSVEDISNLEILLVDILPMDKGSSASTSFEYNEDFLKYLDSNPELEDCKHGLIHSHNKMATFFSGTDISELEDNTKFHNFYLSVVSNNKLELIGKLCFIGKPIIKDIEYSVKNERGSIFNMIFKKKEEPKEEVLSFDCDIELPKNILLSESFIEKVEDVCKPKTVYYNKYNNYNNSYKYSNWDSFENWGGTTYNKNTNSLTKSNKKDKNNSGRLNLIQTNLFSKKVEKTKNFSEQNIENFMFCLLSEFFSGKKFSNINDIYIYIVSNTKKLCENSLLDKLEFYLNNTFKLLYTKIFNSNLQNRESFEDFLISLNSYIDTTLDKLYEENLTNNSKDSISYFFATIEDIISEIDY